MRELQRQLTTLMLCRAVLLSALLGSGLVIGRLLGQPLFSSHRYYLLIGAGFGLTILYTLLHPVWSRSRLAASVQIAGDIVLITGFVYVTGGINSPFSLIYFLPIIAASIMLGRAGAMTFASTAWLTYGFLIVLLVFGVIPEGSSTADVGLEAFAANKRVAYSLFSHFVGFFSVAYLASYLSLKLKAAGAELAEKKETLASVRALNENIIESITSGIVTTALDGTITFMNRGAEEITGRRLETVEGADVASLLGREEGFVRKLETTFQEERRFRFESTTTRSNGAALFLGVSGAILKDQKGCPLGYVFSFQDLTEIKALEEEVRIKDRMAVLGEMSAGIAHEIRNPLASMSGSAQMLKKSLAPGGEEEELLDIVVRESRRLDGIIRDFLMFARPRRFRAEPVDLVPILEDSLTLLRNSGEFTSRHSIRTDFDPRGAEAIADVDLLKQVFWNLSKNALRAMRDGGVLTVRTRYEGPSSLLVSFADEGVGMSDAEIEHAFEPFRGGFHEGTGLGLAVVFRIIEQHKGHIRVRSSVGAGTEVIITIPAARERAAQVARAGVG
ncbi:MAG: nitrogen regulation protein NR(II) [Acidobacteriota bacterium]